MDAVLYRRSAGSTERLSQLPQVTQPAGRRAGTQAQAASPSALSPSALMLRATSSTHTVRTPPQNSGVRATICVKDKNDTSGVGAGSLGFCSSTFSAFLCDLDTSHSSSGFWFLDKVGC